MYEGDECLSQWSKCFTRANELRQKICKIKEKRENTEPGHFFKVRCSDVYG